jgi:hypothetical protein
MTIFQMHGVSAPIVIASDRRERSNLPNATAIMSLTNGMNDSFINSKTRLLRRFAPRNDINDSGLVVRSRVNLPSSEE